MSAALKRPTDPALPSPGEQFIAQVIEHFEKDVVTVWALDAERTFRAHNAAASEWPVGEVVRCRVAPSGRTVDAIERIDDATKNAFRDKLLIAD